jgi:septal ring factor EnvC (AmiA/AmiB activator)
MENYSLALREGLRNFRRDRTLSLAMTGCVAVAVFALGAFALCAINLNATLRRWESRVELVAFLTQGMSEEDSRKLAVDIGAIPGVADARLITGQQSYEELFSAVRDSLDLGGVPLDEVLPASVVVRLTEGSRGLGAIKELASRIDSLDGVDEVKFEELLLERYLQFRRDVAAFTVGASVFWVVVFGIITVNIARLASATRKTGTHTLQMMGASGGFIRRVFTVEGIAQGVAGSAVGIAVLVLASLMVSSRMGRALELPVSVFVAVAAVGPILAVLASWFSVRSAIGRAFTIFALALLTSTAYAESGLESELAKYRDELKQLTIELQQNREAAERIGRKQTAVIRELEQIDKELDGLSRQIKDGESKVLLNQDEIEKARLDLARCEAEYSQSRRELEQWLRMLCNSREPSVVEVILWDVPQSELTRRRKMISLLAREEARAFERTRSLRLELLKQQENLQKRGELDTLYTETTSLRAQQYLEKKKQRQVLLDNLNEQKSIYLAAIADLETSARNLQELIDSQRAETQALPAASVPFREMKGLLPWPTTGEMTLPFGRIRNPGSDTYTRHLGVDISAEAGSEIRAVHQGVVAYCDWFRGYGKLVILDHGGGYNSIYSHCSEILVKKGDPVSAGQPIALVGETGSIKGSFLYFEIRENGQPVDPAVWLQRRQ